MFIEPLHPKPKFKVRTNNTICAKYYGAQHHINAENGLQYVTIYIYVCMYMHYMLPWIQGLLCRQLTASDIPSWQLQFSFCIPKNKERHIGKLIWLCFYILPVCLMNLHEVFLSKQPFLLILLEE